MTSQHAVIDHPNAMPKVYKALQQVHVAINGHGLDPRMQHLIWLRASQINGCAYCVDMHLREARADGESQPRLDRLVVWEQVEDYTAQERAALRWTETLTRLDARADYGAQRDALRQYFSDSEIAALTASIAMINLWNRIQIASHH
jgi:AhpD family alkylhydroperoxidase